MLSKLKLKSMDMTLQSKIHLAKHRLILIKVLAQGQSILAIKKLYLLLSIKIL